MIDVDFERRVERALRAPVSVGTRAKQSIMERVREAAHDGAPNRPLVFPVGRTTRHSLIGIALAAGIGSLTALALPSALQGPRAAGIVTSVVIGDTVVDRLRDTLRLVRLIFDDRSARHVAVLGDFNGWQEGVTGMRRDEATGRWAVTLALQDGEHRFAIVVDNTRLSGVLHVARTTN